MCWGSRQNRRQNLERHRIIRSSSRSCVKARNVYQWAVNHKVLKSENRTRPYLLAVLVEVVVVVFFFFLTSDDEEDDFLFPFLCVALATASLCGQTIPDAGVATIMLLSVVQAAAFFLSCFFGGPLKKIIWYRCLKANAYGSNVHGVYLSRSIAAISSGFPLLHLYQWCPNYLHIGHLCLLLLVPLLPLLPLPPSIADFIMFLCLPAVDLSNGGCMKKPCVTLSQQDLSGILGTEPWYAALNLSTE